MKLIKEKLLYLTGLFFPIFLLTFKSRSLAMYCIFIYVLIVIFEKRTLKIKFDRFFIPMLCLSIITLLVSRTINWDSTWSDVAFSAFIDSTILIFFNFAAKDSITISELMNLKKGLKIACAMQIAWCYIQFITYYTLGININDLIFRDTLHLLSSNTVYLEYGRLSICGFGWHPCQLVGVIVLSYCLFEPIIIKYLLVGLAAISLNTTCMISIVLCFFVDFVVNGIKHNGLKLNKKTIFRCLITMAFGVALIFLFPSMWALVIERLTNILDRLGSGVASITSTTAVVNSSYIHARYYWGYPRIAEYSGAIKTLFGYGYNCSGYPFIHVFSQYVNQVGWGVESDPIHFIVGRGLLWTVIFYAWLIRILRKGFKISAKYTISIVTIILAGIFYNNQFDWFIFIEIVFSICIYLKIDFWSLMEQKEIQKKGRTHIKRRA